MISMCVSDTYSPGLANKMLTPALYETCTTAQLGNAE